MVEFHVLFVVDWLTNKWLKEWLILMRIKVVWVVIMKGLEFEFEYTVMNRVEGNSTKKVITKSGWSQSWSLDGVIVERQFSFSLCAVPSRSLLHLNLWGARVKVRGWRNKGSVCEIAKYSRGLRLIELVKLEPSWNQGWSQNQYSNWGSTSYTTCLNTPSPWQSLVVL